MVTAHFPNACCLQEEFMLCYKQIIKMKGSPKVELCQASKVFEVQFELSLLSFPLEKTSFQNGNATFPVAEVIFLTKSNVTVFLQSPKMWRVLVVLVFVFFHFTQQYFSPMRRPGYLHPAQDPFPQTTPYRNMTIFPRENELSHLSQCPRELPVMKLADNSVLKSAIIFPIYFPSTSSSLSGRSKKMLVCRAKEEPEEMQQEL